MSRPKSLTPEQEAELVTWWLARQLSLADKAASLGISPGTVQNILSRHGVAKRGYKDKLVRRYQAETGAERGA